MAIKALQGAPRLTAAMASVPLLLLLLLLLPLPLPLPNSDCCADVALPTGRRLTREARRAGVQPLGWRATRWASVGSAGWVFGLRWKAWFSRHRLTGTRARCSANTGSQWAAVP